MQPKKCAQEYFFRFLIKNKTHVTKEVEEKLKILDENTKQEDKLYIKMSDMMFRNGFNENDKQRKDSNEIGKKIATYEKEDKEILASQEKIKIWKHSVHEGNSYPVIFGELIGYVFQKMLLLAEFLIIISIIYIAFNYICIHQIKGNHNQLSLNWRSILYLIKSKFSNQINNDDFDCVPFKTDEDIDSSLDKNFEEENINLIEDPPNYNQPKEFVTEVSKIKNYRSI